MKKILIILLAFFKMNTSVAQKYEIQGHRGCRGLLPENTIPAFLKALDLGVDVLEMDIIISKDRQVVVSHEPYFNADITTKPNGEPLEKSEEKNYNLFQMLYAEIATFDCGKRGNLPRFPEQQPTAVYKPLLKDVIQAAENYRIEKNLPEFHYNIEIKSEEQEYGKSQPEIAEFCLLAYNEISKYLPPNRVVVQSFDFNILKYWHKQIEEGSFKKMRLSALVENLKGVNKNLKDLGFTPDIYSPYFKLLNKKNIAILHKRGIRAIPWTVNEVEDMIKVNALGTDGLITDYPNRAKGLF